MASNEDVLGIYGKMATLLDTRKIPWSSMMNKIIPLPERKKSSEDKLKPLIDYTLNKLELRPVRLCIFYVFCQYFFATSLTIFHLLDRFDAQTLLQHGSFCGIQIFVLLNLGSILFLTHDLTSFLRKYAKIVIPIEMMDEQTLKQVLFLIKMIKLISAINLVFATIAAAGFIAAPDYFDEKTYLCVWIRETFPKYKNFMLHVVHWTSLPVALVLAGTAVAFTYASCTAIFQILVVHEMIGAISNSSLPQKLRKDSDLYQEAVRQKMIMSIMAHEYTVRFQTVASEIIDIPLLLLAAGSSILGASLMIEVLSNQNTDILDHYEIYAGIFCFMVAGVISTNMYLIIGQVIKDESQKCNYKLSQLPWYDMNKANKQIYSIFLERSKKNLAFSNSVVQLDYVLLVRIVKSLYSLAALLTRFVSSNEKVG